jgi:hypothetical protein
MKQQNVKRLTTTFQTNYLVKGLKFKQIPWIIRGWGVITIRLRCFRFFYFLSFVRPHWSINNGINREISEFCARVSNNPKELIIKLIKLNLFI